MSSDIYERTSESNLASLRSLVTGDIDVLLRYFALNTLAGFSQVIFYRNFMDFNSKGIIMRIFPLVRIEVIISSQSNFPFFSAGSSTESSEIFKFGII